MNRIKIVLLVLIAIFSQVVAIAIYVNSKLTLNVQCVSTFTRNSWEDYSFVFKGNFIVNLQKSGKGELTIHAWTEGVAPRQIMRHYTFHYNIENQGQIYTRLINETRGASDNVEDAFYRKYFFDLNFDAGGQIRLQRFNDTWLFLSPNLMISTCSPIA